MFLISEEHKLLWKVFLSFERRALRVNCSFPCRVTAYAVSSFTSGPEDTTRFCRILLAVLR